jgi:hypothetical protein
MKPLELDRLLDDAGGTFHDSTLLQLEVDFVVERLRGFFEVHVVIDGQEQLRRGTLVLDGLIRFEMEGNGPLGAIEGSKGLWISADGPLEESSDVGHSKVPKGELAEAGFAYFLFVSDTNSYIKLVSRSVRFEWAE